MEILGSSCRRFVMLQRFAVAWQHWLAVRAFHARACTECCRAAAIRVTWRCARSLVPSAFGCQSSRASSGLVVFPCGLIFAVCRWPTSLSRASSRATWRAVRRRARRTTQWERDLTLQNRVTPFGEIVAVAARGTLMGNRGCLHNDQRQIVKSAARDRWLICRLVWKDVRRPLMAPGKYTELFSWMRRPLLPRGIGPATNVGRSGSMNLRRRGLARSRLCRATQRS